MSAEAKTLGVTIASSSKLTADEFCDKSDALVSEAEHSAKRLRDITDRLRELTAKAYKRTITIDEIKECEVLMLEGKTLQAHSHSLTTDILDVRSGLTVEQDTGAGAVKAQLLADRRFPKELDGTRMLRLSDEVARLAPGRTISNVLAEIVDKAYPQILSLFYPRQYENIGQYHSPKECAVWLTAVVAETLRKGFFDMPTAYRLIMPALKPMIDKKMPMLFVAPELLKAVLLTDFDDDIDWVNMKLPYEQGIFVLPRGGYRHEDDGEVSMILWSRCQGSTDYQPPCKGIPVIQVQNTSLATASLCPATGIWYDACLNANYRPTMKLKNLFHVSTGEEQPRLTISVAGLDEDLTAKDAPFLEGIGVILFGLFMAMNARPELVEKAMLLKRVPGKGDKPAREFWSPNVIGLRYKPKREVPKVKAGKFVFGDKEQERGHHASPRMHWRRGHFRQQAYGKESRLRKTIWIEPCLIGAEV